MQTGKFQKPLLKVIATVAFVVTAFLLSSFALFSQGALTIDLGGTPKEWIKDFPEVSLPVTVVDVNGLPVMGLRAEDFNITEDGNPAPIAKVGIERDKNASSYIVLAIDMSGSMAANKALEKAKAAADVLVDAMGPNDKIAVVAFGNSVNIAPPGKEQPIDPSRERNFTNNKGDLKSLIESLSTTPGKVTTPLWDAALKSVLMASKAPVTRRVVILLTDGREGDAHGKPVSEYTAEDAVIEAVKDHVPVFTIGLGKEVDEKYLRTVAERTGGTYHFTDDPDKIKEIYLQLLARLEQRYKINYRSTLRADGKEHAISISVSSSAGSATKTVRVTLAVPVITISRINYLKPSGVRGEGAKLVRLQNGQKIAGDLVIEPVIDAPHGIAQVEYYVNGKLEKRVTEAPYRFYVSAGKFKKETPISIRVRAIDKANPASVAEESVNVIMEPASGGRLPGWLLVLAAIIIVAGLAVIVCAIRRSQLRKEQAEWMSPVVVGGGGPEPPTVAEGGGGGVEEPMVNPFAGGRLSTGEGALPGSPTVAPDMPPSAPSFETGDTWFTVISDDVPGRTYPIVGDDMIIGRSPNADVTIDHPTVSRQHARLKWINGRYRLFDLGSKNGTMVNGKRVQSTMLRDGDKVQLGDVVLSFRSSRV